MKNFTKVFAIAIAMFGFATSSFAQAERTATADASATIITPITIVKNTDLDFGTIAIQASALNRSITLVAASDAAPLYTDGITVPSTSVTPTAAKFTVSGAVDYTYSFTYPETISLTNTGDPMTVTLSCNNGTTPGNGVGTLLSGQDVLYFGGVLAISNTQTEEEYNNNAGLEVIVNYN